MSALLQAADELDPTCLSSLKPITAYNVVFPARLQITNVESLWTFLVDNKVITRSDISTIELGYKPPADPKNGFGVFLLLVPNDIFLVSSSLFTNFVQSTAAFKMPMEDISVSTSPSLSQSIFILLRKICATLPFALKRAGFCSRIIRRKISHDEGLRRGCWVGTGVYQKRLKAKAHAATRNW